MILIVSVPNKARTKNLSKLVYFLLNYELLWVRIVQYGQYSDSLQAGQSGIKSWWAAPTPIKC